jgi:hypothetical protein
VRVHREHEARAALVVRGVRVVGAGDERERLGRARAAALGAAEAEAARGARLVRRADAAVQAVEGELERDLHERVGADVQLLERGAAKALEAEEEHVEVGGERGGALAVLLERGAQRRAARATARGAAAAWCAAAPADGAAAVSSARYSSTVSPSSAYSTAWPGTGASCGECSPHTPAAPLAKTTSESALSNQRLRPSTLVCVSRPISASSSGSESSNETQSIARSTVSSAAALPASSSAWRVRAASSRLAVV